MEAQYFENESKNENVLTKILTIVGIVLMAVLVIYAFVSIQNKMKETKYIGTSANENTIMISETGTVFAIPNIALTTFTAITEEATINEALRKNREKSIRITDFLKRQNVKEEDMKTVDFNVYPKYEWQTKGVDLEAYPLGKRVIVGYEAVESVEVKIRDNNQIGTDIQGSIEAGASQVSGLQFIIDNEEDLKNQAREDAINKAALKAKSIASKLGVGLGDVLSFTESYVPPYSAAEKATVGSGNNMQIVVGANKIEVTVNVSYEIK
ncbi:MAG: SIMPL domain-containing protein [Candidatus Pacebacteria bacterium]|nr:SIMPL domain-containing protein [Candidatus Paceibacterota bacterium]